MRFVDLPGSGHAGGGPVRLFSRERGSGPVVLVLHGGWGHGVYAFDAAVDSLVAAGLRVLVPDRSGYGRSTPLAELPPAFHARAADEMRAYLDALGVGRALLWGHSDGAVIAALLALCEPERFPRVVLEATHLWKAKPASRAFFETCAGDPDAFGARAAQALRADHGERWRDVVRMNGRAWLRLGAEARGPHDDLYDGALGGLRSRVLLLHGARDPRTEPGEWDALAAGLPHAEPALLPEGAHSPHTDRASAAEAVRRAVGFLSQ